jgi:hypothetical protein
MKWVSPSLPPSLPPPPLRLTLLTDVRWCGAGRHQSPSSCSLHASFSESPCCRCQEQGTIQVSLFLSSPHAFQSHHCPSNVSRGKLPRQPSLETAITINTKVQIPLRLSHISLCLFRGIVALLQSFSSQCSLSIDPLDYIAFYSLRTWDVLKDKVMTEEIYIRSKVIHPPSSPH